MALEDRVSVLRMSDNKISSKNFVPLIIIFLSNFTIIGYIKFNAPCCVTKPTTQNIILIPD